MLFVVAYKYVKHNVMKRYALEPIIDSDLDVDLDLADAD